MLLQVDIAPTVLQELVACHVAHSRHRWLLLLLWLRLLWQRQGVRADAAAAGLLPGTAPLFEGHGAVAVAQVAAVGEELAPQLTPLLA